jgi:putative flippase GtrA
MLLRNLIQFIKFGIVGISNTAIGLGTYYFFLWLGAHYLIANILSWVVSVFNAFYWNHKYVFESDQKWLFLLIKTYASYGASFLTGTVLLYILVELLMVSDVLAPLVCLLITIPMNFLLNKFWTFKNG